jgi:hypothetical protein
VSRTLFLNGHESLWLILYWHDMTLYDIIWYDMVWYDMIYEMIWYIWLTANGLTPISSSSVHIYTQTLHRTSQWNRIHRTEHI